MNKYPLALLLLAGASYAHDTDYKHFHEEPTSLNEPNSASPVTQATPYSNQAIPLYASFGIHRVQKFELADSSSNAPFAKPRALNINFGYAINPNAAVEIGGISFGESDTFSTNGSTNSDTDTRVYGFTLGGRLTHAFDSKLHASLSAGLMFWRVKTDVKQSFTSFPGKGSSRSFHENASDPYWSAGLGFELSPNTIIKLNYNEYMQKDIFKSSANNIDLEQSTLSLSIEIMPGRH